MWSLFWEMTSISLCGRVAANRMESVARVVVIAVFALLALARFTTVCRVAPWDWMDGFVRVSFSFFIGIVLWHLRVHLVRLYLPVAPRS